MGASRPPCLAPSPSPLRAALWPRWAQRRLSPWRTTTLYCAASRSSSATNEAHAVARNGRATTPRGTHILTIQPHTPQTSVALRRAAPPPGGLLWTRGPRKFRPPASSVLRHPPLATRCSYSSCTRGVRLTLQL